MPAKGDQKRRHKVIQELLGMFEVENQKELVALLKERGIEATQSGVSRDLQKLRAIRVNGVYEIPVKPVDDSAYRKVREFVREGRPAGPYQTLLITDVNAGPLVARGINATAFPEVVGTVAGPDSVLVLTENEAGQRHFFNRLKDHMKPESEIREVKIPGD